MTRRSPRRWQERLHSLYRWHRWLGVSASLFLIWLAVSGILINHATDFGLDQLHVRSDAVVKQYGIHIDPPATGYAIGEHWISETDNQLWWNDRALQVIPSQLAGAAPIGRFWFAAGRDWLVLGSSDGEIVESLSADALPHPVDFIATSDSRLCLGNSGFFSCSTVELDRWTPESRSIQKASALDLPEALALRIRDQAQYGYIHWERLLRDLHSGRFFGNAGVLVVDAVAIIMLILAFTGLTLWVRYLVRLRRRARYNKSH